MFSQKIIDYTSRGSMIRAMFEEGTRLKKIYGPDKVYDFSLGNPDLEPPAEVKDTLKSLVLESKPGMHSYMPNAGYPAVREKVAAHIRKETGVEISDRQVVMTCGAAGGLNVVLKTLLNPGEEVVVFAPYFVEYAFYIDNYEGKTVVVPPDTTTFAPDVQALEKYITPKTKALILNSPNNPTGVVYSERTLREIAALLEKKEKEYNTVIFVISDEPYAKIVYHGIQVPSILKIFRNSLVINSFSKSLGLPGERIGYIAAHPAIDQVDLLMDGLIFCNRTLGYVNAPALFQKVIAEALDAGVNVEEYQRRGEVLYNGLTRLGFSCIKPQGAFYLFPKALIEDDVEFKNRALKYNLLLVPGSGFGCPGYFRLTYCVSMKTIEDSLPAFEALVKECM